MEVSVEKPGSPEDILAHYGKKGMKWGVRTESRPTARSATKAGQAHGREVKKQARAAGAGRLSARTEGRRAGVREAQRIHKEARAANPNVAASRQFREKFPTSRTKAAEIRRARAQSQLDFTNYTNQPRGPERDRLKKVYLNNPDRAIALRSTRGEKVVDGILLGALGTGVGVGATVGAPVVVPAVAGGALAGTLVGLRAGRRRVERKQARGSYG